MEEETVTIPNGGAPAAVDSPDAVPNGHAFNPDETLAIAPSSITSADAAAGSDDAATAKAEQHEILVLKTTISVLQGKLQLAETEIERSEVEKKAIASHASHLEGQIIETQEHIISLQFAAESASEELKNSLDVINERTAEKAALEAKVGDLEKRLEELKLEVDEERAKTATKKEEISALEQRVKKLEEQVTLSSEENRNLVVEVRCAKENEAILNGRIKKLLDTVTELEEKVQGPPPMEIKRDLPVVENGNVEEVGTAAAEGFRVSWPAAAAAVASTATVAATATVIYLRAKQRSNTRLWVRIVEHDIDMTSAPNWSDMTTHKFVSVSCRSKNCHLYKEPTGASNSQGSLVTSIISKKLNFKDYCCSIDTTF